MVILDVLKERLNLRKAHIKGDEIWALCINPAHNDSNPTNFSINLKNGKFKCFACGFAGNILTVLTNVGLNYDESIAIWNQIRDFEEEITIPDYEVDRFIVNAYIENGFSQYALDRVGGDEEVLSVYNVYSDIFRNPIFLVQNYSGVWKAVWVRENDTGQYILIEPLQSKSYGDLFGEHLPDTGFTVINEGPFDSINVYQASGFRAVCLNGLTATRSQLAKLRKMEPLIVMLDFDERGKAARLKMHDELIGVESYFCGSTKYAGLDPGSLNGKQILEVLNNKMTWFEFAEWRRKYDVKHD